MLLGFGLGGWEIAIILIVVVLIFGPSKLPQLGSSVGKMLGGFKKEMKAMKEEGDEAEGDKAGEIDVTPADKG
jgi:sec-independent protein translocase protein TatA